MEVATNKVGGAGVHLEPSRARSADKDRDDPLAPIFVLGNRAAKTGTAIGLVLALVTHGYASGRAMTALFDMQRAIREMRQGLHDFFWTEYDIDIPPEQKAEEKKEEPPPEPEPEPEPAPKMDKPAPKEEDPYEDKTPPPPPSQAAKVLTAKEDPDEPVDMTGNGFVSGDGTGPGFGMVSAEGTGKNPTYNKAASLDGKEGGTGSGKAPPPPGPDLSKPPEFIGSRSWDCPFPPEADAEQIDQATASVMVTVRPDGSVQSVKVTNDPGYGFGRAARVCALAKRFSPALDKTGQPTTGVIGPINVRFTR